MRILVSIQIGVLTWCLHGAQSRGAPPQLDAAHPCGAKAGSTTTVALSGKVGTWPPKIWSSNSKLTFEPAEKAPSVGISIPKGAAPGPCLIRVWNEEGASEPILFLVSSPNGKEYVENEKEKNDSLSEPAKIGLTPPCVIYGRLNPSRDADCYSINLNAGQKIFAVAESYTFRSGVDAALHLFNPQGDRVALAHDWASHLDPLLTCHATTPGEYILAVTGIATPPNANVYFHGNAKSVYRLHLAAEQSQLPARLLPAAGSPDGNFSKTLQPPFNLYHTLSSDDRPKELRFAAKAKEKYLVEALAYQDRYPTDPVFTLKREEKTIREVDDGPSKTVDASYLWTAPRDGEYSLAIRDRFGRTGPEYRCRVRVVIPEPSVSGTVEKSSYTVKAGGNTAVKIKIDRKHGHDAALKLGLKGLPAGITFDPPKIPTKSGDVTLKIKAKKDAPAFSGPVEFILQDEKGNPAAVCAFSFQSKDSRGPYLIDEIESVWLTVTK